MAENDVTNPGTTEPPPAYSFQTLQRRSPLLADIFRGALILLAFVVALGFVMISLPQGAFDRIARRLQPAPVTPVQEKLAFLYLGDEVRNDEFHIRGVIRNIATQPLEKVDATVRIYASDGSLLETAVVRMDKEVIAPDATAEFHLVYPGYKAQFGSYSVEFKTRDGQTVPYKDMRGVRSPN